MPTATIPTPREVFNPPPEKTAFTETATLELVEASGATGRRMRVQLITPGWGSSGYYSEAVLKEAARQRVFPAGTTMYIDHQTLSESVDRIHGERSMKDLAARFTSDAVWDDNAKALVAPQVEAFGPWRPVLAEMKDHVGVSIRSFGMAEMGEAEGRTGPIVKSIDYAQSVDFVAEAGRGGRILQLLESARADLGEARNVGQWLEARLHLAFTEIADHMYGEGRLSRDERIALSSAISDALTGFATRVEAEAPQLLARDLWQGPEASEQAETSLGGTDGDAPPPGGDTIDAAEAAAAATPPVPAAPAAGSTADPSAPPVDVEIQESKEDTMTDTPGAGTAPPSLPTVRQATEAELAETRRELAQTRARERARIILGESLRDQWVPPSTVTRITESLLAALPLTQEMKLDEAELSKRVVRELSQAEAEIAEALGAAGLGRPRDLGHISDPTLGGLGQDQIDARLEESFRSLGLSESATKTAVKGR
ncbi:hypothetical protein [Phytoactinopolyspora limicola]|uniref:hypothetical protein n=1 Tax=Phytoactinopolyspora limicola TaxID=2715536 RepID=UPI0014086C40|nr:hypothetical protein [Phytoactinopolyspora limicola]